MLNVVGGLIGSLLLNIHWLCVTAIVAGCLTYWFFHGYDERLGWTIVGLVGVLISNKLCSLFCSRGALLRPDKLDRYIYNLDGLLHCQPSFAMGRLIHDRLYLIVLCKSIYFVAPFTLLAVFYGFLWFRSKAEAIAILPVAVLNIVIGVTIYMLVPVSGPAYAFPSYPQLPSEPVVSEVVPINAPPNGVPSLHFSTALLILWYARKLPYGTLLGSVFLMLTTGAILGLGEHYVFDLVVAVPYTVMVYKLGTSVARLVHTSVNGVECMQATTR